MDRFIPEYEPHGDIETPPSHPTALTRAQWTAIRRAADRGEEEFADACADHRVEPADVLDFL